MLDNKSQYFASGVAVPVFAELFLMLVKSYHKN